MLETVAAVAEGHSREWRQRDGRDKTWRNVFRVLHGVKLTDRSHVDGRPQSIFVEMLHNPHRDFVLDRQIGIHAKVFSLNQMRMTV
jgi:hypothetical protein